MIRQKFPGVLFDPACSQFRWTVGTKPLSNSLRTLPVAHLSAKNLSMHFLPGQQMACSSLLVCMLLSPPGANPEACMDDIHNKNEKTFGWLHRAYHHLLSFREVTTDANWGGRTNWATRQLSRASKSIHCVPVLLACLGRT